MDVLPYLLSEQDVIEIPDDFLRQLAQCSTERVKIQIKAYLDKSDCNLLAKEKVIRAYSDIMDLEAYLGSDETKTIVGELLQIRFEDINVNQEESELLKILDSIAYVIDSDKAVPYLAPIAGDIVKDLKERVKEFLKSNNNNGVRHLRTAIEKHGDLFRDDRFTPFKGTSVKHVVKNNEKYEIIRRGVEFTLKCKRGKLAPESWRYL